MEPISYKLLKNTDHQGNCNGLMWYWFDYKRFTMVCNVLCIRHGINKLHIRLYTTFKRTQTTTDFRWLITISFNPSKTCFKRLQLLCENSKISTKDRGKIKTDCCYCYLNLYWSVRSPNVTLLAGCELIITACHLLKNKDYHALRRNASTRFIDNAPKSESKCE